MHQNEKYLGVGNDFHLKSISFNKPLNSLQVHPPIIKQVQLEMRG